MTVDSAQSQVQAVSDEQQWKLFGLWILVALIASLAVIPYTVEIMSAATRVDGWWELVPGIVTERIFLSAIAICLGLVLGPKVGLESPNLRNWLAGSPGSSSHWRLQLAYSIIFGVAVGVTINVVSPWLERMLMPELPESARHAEEVAKRMDSWKTALACFSAGVIEELLFRFGAMTFFAWLGSKMARRQPSGAAVVWTANLLAALLFGLLHLTNVVEFGITITFGVVLYVTFVNGTAGLIFGWLYWRHGLGAAMLAHVVADIVLKVIIPAA